MKNGILAAKSLELIYRNKHLITNAEKMTKFGIFDKIRNF